MIPNPLHWSPRKVFIRSAVACFLLTTAIFSISLEKIQRLPLDGSQLEFNAKNAHGHMVTLAKKFPYRLPWHENRRKAGAWIENTLRSFGYEPKSMMFSEIIAQTEYTDLKNIYAEKKGSTNPDEIIVLLAHYDTTDTTVEGAMDDASGVGVVLEMARIFASQETKRTVIFLLSDSEEFGALWGATNFAQNFDRRDKIVAALSLDFVAPEKQIAILGMYDGLKSGYTPLWLREISLGSLRSIGGFEAVDLLHIVEFTQRAIQIPAADHGAFLKEGIPAINWVGQNTNFAREMAHYHHTPYDVAEALQVESFAQFGQSAERFVKSVDRLSKIPKDFRNSNYLKITRQHYLDGGVVLVLQILAFIPFLLFSVTKFSLTLPKYSRAEILKVMRNEAKNLAILVGSMLVGYGLLRLLPSLHIIAQYETFPATQKSLILYNPDFLPIALVTALVIFVYLVFRRIFRESTDAENFPEIRFAFHTAFLTLITIVAFFGNSYLATLLLLPPAYCWMLVKSTPRAPGKILNTLLLLGGSITLVAGTVVMMSIFHVGVVYWYFFLSAAYGLFSVFTVVMFLMALATMLRLFRAAVLH